MLGGSTGISVFVVLLEQRIEFHATNLGATQTAANSATMEMLGQVSGRLATAGLPDVQQYGAAMNYLGQMVTAQANMLGFQDGFVFLAMMALAPLLPAALLLRKVR